MDTRTGGAVKPTWRFAINARGKKQAGEHQLKPFPFWSDSRKLTEIHPIWVILVPLEELAYYVIIYDYPMWQEGGWKRFTANWQPTSVANLNNIIRFVRRNKKVARNWPELAYVPTWVKHIWQAHLHSWLDKKGAQNTACFRFFVSKYKIPLGEFLNNIHTLLLYIQIYQVCRKIIILNRIINNYYYDCLPIKQLLDCL